MIEQKCKQNKKTDEHYLANRFKIKGKLRIESIILFRMQQNKRKYKDNKTKGR